jgi:hypothetical protein
MFIYFVVGLVLVIGGTVGMVEGIKDHSAGISLVSFVVIAIGAVVCLAVLFM